MSNLVGNPEDMFSHDEAQLLQVPQFILDDYLQKGIGSQCRIFCTQPRRISAVSVADRVAAERAEKIGQSTGYMIRLEQ